jgi:hypothetical protein
MELFHPSEILLYRGEKLIYGLANLAAADPLAKIANFAINLPSHL